MNEILGKEPSTNPNIMIAALNVDTPIIESARSSTEPRTPSPMPSSDGMTDTDSSFNTGKKVKQKKNSAAANSEVLDVVSDHLAIRSQEVEERRKEREERKKEREERKKAREEEKIAKAKVDEAIIEAQRSSAKMMDSVTLLMERMFNKE